MAEIQEQLEESQMTLNTMNAMRHVLPFKDRVLNMLSTLSDVAGRSHVQSLLHEQGADSSQASG